MGLQMRVSAVNEFHKKLDLMQRKDWIPWDAISINAEAGEHIEAWASKLEEHNLSLAEILRPHLILEEMAELLTAKTEIEALDAMGDLLYVLLGTCAIYDWPIETVFDEIHRSNMSKQRKSDDPGRVRDKGDEYSPPKLEPILKAWRERKTGVRKGRTLKEIREAKERRKCLTNTTPSESTSSPEDSPSESNE